MGLGSVRGWVRSVRGGVRECERWGEGVWEVGLGSVREGLGSVRGGVRECERWG